MDINIFIKVYSEACWYSKHKIDCIRVPIDIRCRGGLSIRLAQDKIVEFFHILIYNTNIILIYGGIVLKTEVKIKEEKQKKGVKIYAPDRRIMWKKASLTPAGEKDFDEDDKRKNKRVKTTVKVKR